jgi:imidazole glycerol-phosphate synthase subunit HisF
VVVVLDVRRGRAPGSYEVWTHNGTKNTGIDPRVLIRQMQDVGAGEIVLNSIDQDGVMKGYDLELVRLVRPEVTVPMTVLGGAGTLADIGALYREAGLVGAAAGSLFVFKGAFRAVLINYPDHGKKAALWREVAVS